MTDAPGYPNIERLLDIMARLRDPERGCPWDIEQDFSTIAPYTIEEAYEVMDAIKRNDMTGLKDELGDLLLQTVYHARMAEEAGLFDFGDVVQGTCDKMIRRHPHVFGKTPAKTGRDVRGVWERRKAAERAGKSTLDGVALALPALLRSYKLQNRAARVGFDWAEAKDVLPKIREELSEIISEISEDMSPEAVKRRESEVGDLLFSCVNLARKLGIDPEVALRGTNERFEKRFSYIEKRLTEQGGTPENSDLETMDYYWEEAKLNERK